MQIVIEIDEDAYKEIKKIVADGNEMCFMQKLIANGTPLPKGHGRLIDADEYKEHLYACETNGRPLHIMELDERLATVDDAPTIIEADKEELKATKEEIYEIVDYITDKVNGEKGSE